MQVWIQPFYGFVEIQCFKRFPNAKFLQYELFAVNVRNPPVSPVLGINSPSACQGLQ
jgi:hypothetical protein